jgi:AraC family transcriptional regulator
VVAGGMHMPGMASAADWAHVQPHRPARAGIVPRDAAEPDGYAGRRDGGRRSSVRAFGWDGLSLELARWHPGTDSEGVVHLPDHLLFVTLGGRTGRTEAEIEGTPPYHGADFPGAVTFIPAGRLRRARFEGGAIDYAAIRLDARKVCVPDGNELVGFTNRPDPFIGQLVLALCDEARIGGAGGAVFVDSIATALLWHLVRRYSDPAAAPARRYRPLSGAALGRVVGYIEQNLAGDLRLSRLAEVAGMSRHGFGHAFKEATGTSPHRYVTERRIESAAALLAGSDVPIADVALRVGLSSQSHLTTVFRGMVGETPNAYRRARRFD